MTWCLIPIKSISGFNPTKCGKADKGEYVCKPLHATQLKIQEFPDYQKDSSKGQGSWLFHIKVVPDSINTMKMLKISLISNLRHVSLVENQYEMFIVYDITALFNSQISLLRRCRLIFYISSFDGCSRCRTLRINILYVIVDMKVKFSVKKCSISEGDFSVGSLIKLFL